MQDDSPDRVGDDLSPEPAQGTTASDTWVDSSTTEPGRGGSDAAVGWSTAPDGPGAEPVPTHGTANGAATGEPPRTDTAPDAAATALERGGACEPTSTAASPETLTRVDPDNAGSGAPEPAATAGDAAAGTGGAEQPIAGAAATVGPATTAGQLTIDDAAVGDPGRLRAVVEAVLLVADEPTRSVALAQGLGVPLSDIEHALRDLQAEYDAGRRGFDLREIADGWRLYTRDELAPYVERFVLEGQHARLTQAALETLAVVAYRQPVTRSRVSAIRGVNVDGVMRTLLSRGLIEECGSDPDTGGGLYRTTSFFLEKMGLKSLSELPSLAPLLPDTSQLDDVGLST
jgi:segregation and condensation protein B